jgi:hypothetical protein
MMKIYFLLFPIHRKQALRDDVKIASNLDMKEAGSHSEPASFLYRNLHFFIAWHWWFFGNTVAKSGRFQGRSWRTTMVGKSFELWNDDDLYIDLLTKNF